MPIIKEGTTRVFTASITFGAKLDVGDYTQERVDGWVDTVHTFTHLFAIKENGIAELKQKFIDSEEFNNIEKSEEFDDNFLDSREFKAYTTYKYAKKTFADLGPLADLMEDMSTVLSSDVVDITEFADLEKIKDYE